MEISNTKKIIDNYDFVKSFRSNKNVVFLGKYSNELIVIKQYHNNTFMKNEVAMLKEMKNTGYVPAILEQGKDYVVLNYIEGDMVESLYKNAIFFSDEESLIELAHQVSVFLQMFHTVTNNVLYDINFRNFIISNKRCYCIDFEHCIKGYVNKDIAGIVANALILAEQDVKLSYTFIKTILEDFHVSFLDIINDLSTYLDNVIDSFGFSFDKSYLMNIYILMSKHNRDFLK